MTAIDDIVCFITIGIARILTEKVASGSDHIYLGSAIPVVGEVYTESLFGGERLRWEAQPWSECRESMKAGGSR
jgi:hypothetical protein